MLKRNITKEGQKRIKRLLDALAKDKTSIVSTSRDMVELILRGKKDEVMPLFNEKNGFYFATVRALHEQGFEGMMAYVAMNEPETYDIRSEGLLVTPIVLDFTEMTATLYKLNVGGSIVWCNAQGKVYSHNEMEQMMRTLRDQADDFQNFFDPWHNYTDPNL